MYRFLTFTYAVLMFCIANMGKSKADVFNTFSYKALPSLCVGGNQGIASPFAGTINGCILVGGGCNFPDTPVAQGGLKKFYAEIYGTKAEHPDGWRLLGRLNTPAAYGASVSVGNDLVWIGGNDGHQSLTDVTLLQSTSGGLKQQPLPPLPIALDNMAATYANGYIYVAGGQNNGTARNSFLRMKFPDGTQWEQLPGFPGMARLQPVFTAQSSATGTCLYLIGGYDPTYGTVSDGLCYNPATKQWRAIAPIRINGKDVAVAGSGCVNAGNSYIICLGGVDKHVFDRAITRQDDSTTTQKEWQAGYLLHQPSWYRFRQSLLSYNTITDTWAEVPGNPLIAGAGAGVVSLNISGTPHWIVINGEIKPGIRSAGVTDITVGNHTSFGWANWAVLIGYLLVMLWLGYFFMHREQSANDFFTGGGRIPWWAAGISIFATIMSAITYMSIPAKAYATDWKYYPMQVMILIVAFPVIKYYLPFFRRLNVSTAYAYLERRFNYGVRFMASTLFMAFMVARMALVLFLPSLAMSAVTDLNIFVCIALMSLITIIYCTMGGMEAVVWGDVLQGFILVGGALFAAVYLVTQTQGGADEFVHLGMTDHKFVLFDWSLDYRTPTFWVIIIGGLANNLISYTSDQTIIQRYMTTKSEGSASRSIFTNAFLQILVSIVFYTIGTGLYTFFKTHPTSLDITMSKTDAIFPFFMMSQLPQGIAGLLIAALFAATMSTISSNINSISTAFTIDIYKKWRPMANERRTLIVARWAGIIAGLAGTAIAVLMAVVDIQSLLDYFNTILGLLTGSIGGLFMMGIFFKRISAQCALIGFVAGTAVVFYMNYCTQANFFLFGFVSMAVSVMTAWVLSLILPNRKDINGLTYKTLNNSTH